MSDDLTPEQISAAMRATGKKGGQRTKERMLERDPDWYAKIGRKGGEKTAATHGLDHYRSIGKKGGSVIKTMSAERRATETK